MPSQYSNEDKYPDDQLNNLIANYERLGKMETDEYRSLLEERNRRRAGELDLTKTIDYLAACARKHEFATYGGVASSNDREWSYELYRKIGHHMGIVLGYCRANGLPPLSAICVDKGNAQTGSLKGQTLEGFIGGMKMYYGTTSIADKETFLKQQQQRCFDFYQEQNRGRS